MNCASYGLNVWSTYAFVFFLFGGFVLVCVLESLGWCDPTLPSFVVFSLFCCFWFCWLQRATPTQNTETKTKNDCFKLCLERKQKLLVFNCFLALFHDKGLAKKNQEEQKHFPKSFVFFSPYLSLVFSFFVLLLFSSFLLVFIFLALFLTMLKARQESKEETTNNTESEAKQQGTRRRGKWKKRQKKKKKKKKTQMKHIRNGEGGDIPKMDANHKFKPSNLMLITSLNHIKTVDLSRFRGVGRS